MYRVWVKAYNKKKELISCEFLSDKATYDDCLSHVERLSKTNFVSPKYKDCDYNYEFEIRECLYFLNSYFFRMDDSITPYMCRDSAPSTERIIQRFIDWEINAIKEGKGYYPKLAAHNLEVLFYFSEAMYNEDYTTQHISPVLREMYKD